MFGKNALVVDDSLTARAVLKHQLNQFDVVVESAPDGNQALRMLRSHTPDVIFLDHVMPGLDGFQVLERLKADEATRRIPVVMYTSQAAPQYIREARILGAVAVIPKNVTDAELVDALNKAEVYQLRAANDDLHTQTGNREVTAAADGAVPAARFTAEYDAQPTGLAVAPGAVVAGIRHWPVALLLTALVCSQGYMFWRDSEQRRIIGELQRVAAAEQHKVSEMRNHLEFQQLQLNETNARMVEFIMQLLLDRVGEVSSQDSPDLAGDTAFEE